MPRAKKTAAKRSKSVAVTGLAGLPTTIQERIAAKQERFASREKPLTGKQLSIRNGKFRFEGTDLGTEIDVVVLDYVFVNQYFNTDYDPDTITPPACFAIADEEQDLRPIEGLSDIQGDENGKCDGCWANQFESAARGKGKACQNRRRVAVISAEYYGQDGFLDTLTPESVGYITMGGTSLNAWRSYTNKLGKTLKVAPFQVITRLSFDETVDYPKLEFNAAEAIEDSETLGKLLEITDVIGDELRSVPDFSSADEGDKKPAKKKAASKKKASGGRTAAKKPAARRSKFA